MEAPEGMVEVLYPRSEARAKAKAEADAEAEAEQEEHPKRPATNWRGVVDYKRHRAPSLEAGVEPVPPDMAARVKGNNFWFNVRALAGCRSSDLRRIANEYALDGSPEQAADTDKPCRGNAVSIILLGCESYDRLSILNGIIAAALDRQRGTPLLPHSFSACLLLTPRRGHSRPATTPILGAHEGLHSQAGERQAALHRRAVAHPRREPNERDGAVGPARSDRRGAGCALGQSRSGGPE